MLLKLIFLNDLQFLIGKDGSMVIADPMAVIVGERDPLRKSLDMIDKLIEVAEKNIKK